MNNNKGKISSIIATVLGSIYVIFAVWFWYFGGKDIATWLRPSEGVLIGGLMALQATVPHIVISIIAEIGMITNFIFNKKIFMLISAISFIIAGLCFPMMFVFVILPSLFGFISCAITAFG